MLTACSPTVVTPALDTDRPFSRRTRVTSESNPTRSFAHSSKLRPFIIIIIMQQTQRGYCSINNTNVLHNMLLR
ncbi:hypothetical protein Hanom_Chr02g00130971 [Helianthus anomalus]